MPRTEPVSPPYDAETSRRLARMMPPGVSPILLFRTFVKNPAMTEALMGWGGYELSDDLSLTLRDREILIDRTCARCGCEYEWGVHVVFFGERASLTREQIVSLTHGGPDDACWTDERDRLLVAVADSLHDDARLGDEVYAQLAATFSVAQVLDVMMLCGWYHAISFTANGLEVDLEPDAARFADYQAKADVMTTSSGSLS